MDAIWQPVIDSIVLILFVAYGIGLITLYKRQTFPPFHFKLIFALYLLQIMVFVSYVLLRDSTSSFWRWMTNLPTGEYNLTATFSAMTIGLVAFVCLSIVIFTRKRWHRGFWLFMFAVFFFLSVDEYFLLHEYLEGWIPYYLAGGIVFILVNLAAFLRTGMRRHIIVMLAILGGAAVVTSGSVGLEMMVEHFNCFDAIVYESCQGFAAIEEVLENMGFSIIFVGVLFYAIQTITVRRQSAFRLAAATSGAWCAVMIAFFWIMPALEIGTIATPINISYAGIMGVDGYRTSVPYLYPGDTLRTEIYTHVDGEIHENYGFSLHLLQQPVIESIAQADSYPEAPAPALESRLQGHIVRTPLFITLPEDLITPASYYLSLSLWYGVDEYVLVEETATDLYAISPGSIVLGTIPVLSPSVDTSGLEETAYSFANGAVMTGKHIELSADNSALNLQFAWRADSALDTQMSQMLILHHIETGAEFVFDAPPFDSRYLMTDWVRGIVEIDCREIMLTADMPAGEYLVISGLYELETYERVPVVDADGQPVLDNAILLGQITIYPTAVLADDSA